MVRRALRSDAVRSGIRYALALVIADAILLALLGPGSPTLLGSFAVTMHLYFLDFDGSRRERAIGQCSAGMVGIVAVCLGTLVSSSLWLALGASVIVAGGFAYARVLRGYVARAAVGLQGAFFLPVIISPSMAELPDLLLGWSVGSMVAIVIAVFVLPRRRHSEVRDRLGAWLTAAAALTEAAVERQPLDPRVADLDAARNALLQQMTGSPSRPGILGRRERALNQMVARARWSMPLARRLVPLAPGDDSMLARASARAFLDAATIVTTGTVPPGTPDLRSLRAADLSHLAEHPATDLSHYAQRVMSIAAMTQLFLAGTSRGLQLPSPDVGGLRDGEPASLLRSGIHRHSVWLLNAVRTGIGAAVCVALAHTLGLENGLWIVLPALSCIQSSFSGPESVRRMLAVAGGSIVGVILAFAALLPAWAPGLFLLIVGTAAFIAKLGQGRRPSLAQMTFTPVLMLNVTLLGWPPQSGLGILRVEDVVLGVSVAALITLMTFPRGVTRLLGRLEERARTISSGFLAAAVAAARSGTSVPPASRDECLTAILEFERALDAAYLNPAAADGQLSAHEEQAELARDRLVGADACLEIAALASDDPRMIATARVCAQWWETAEAATTSGSRADYRPDSTPTSQEPL